MRLMRGIGPVVLAFWGCVLPAAFLAKIDDYVRNHGIAGVARIYGQSAILYVPLILLAFLGIVLAASVIRMFRRRGPTWGELVNTGSVELARLLVLGSLISCLYTWIQGLHPGLILPATVKIAILILAVVSSLVMGRRAADPRRFVHVLKFVTAATAATVVYALLTARSASAADGLVHLMKADRAGSAASRPADVVLITVDALSAQHTSVYEARRDTTPNLRALGDHATVFDRFYANGNWTQPGVSALLSGQRPWTTHADNIDSGPDRDAMTGNLLEIARRAGYTTLTVTTNFNAAPERQKVEAWVDDERYPAPGEPLFFFHYLVEWKLGFSGEVADQKIYQTILAMVPQTLVDRYLNGGPNRFFNPEPAMAAARQLWEQHAGSPRFIWVHIMPPHGPYAAPEPFLGHFDPGSGHSTYQTSGDDSGSGSLLWFGAKGHQPLLNALSDRYDEAALYADHYVGGFLDWLRSRGDFDPSLIIVTSDHGENFHHEYGDHGGPRLYEEVIHVPLLIKLPGQIDGRRRETLAEQVDLVPTVAALLSVVIPSVTYEGKVLSLESGSPDAVPGPPAFSMSLNENPNPERLTTGSIALIDGPYKFVHYFGNLRYTQMPAFEDELYKLPDDAGEEHNLAATEPEIREKMLGEVEEAMAAHGRRPDAE